MNGVSGTASSRASLWPRALVGGLGLVLVAAIRVLAATDASAQENAQERVRQGEAVFAQRCTVCHTIGRGVLIGPDLQGVTERREGSWLKLHIQSPSTHHAQNDPIALANLERFRMRMPDLGLTEQQVEAAIAYLKTSQPARAVPGPYLPTLAIGVLAIVGLTLIGLIGGTKKVEVRP